MSTRKRLFLFAAAFGLTYVAPLGDAQSRGKFYKVQQSKFSKACGDGLDEHSACGDCARVVGVAVTKSASCGHVCTTLPSGKTDKDMNFQAKAANAGNVPTVPTSEFKPCGSGFTAGECAIRYARFEGTEYYADKNQLCGRFKNWSNTDDRVFQIIVSEK